LKGSTSNWVLYALCVVIVLVLTVFPIVTFLNAILNHPEHLPQLWERSTLVALFNTLWVALSALVLSLAIAVPLAFCVTRTDIPFRNTLKKSFFFGYVLPPYLFAIAWITLAVPEVGLLNRTFGLSLNIYSLAGLIFVFTSAHLPIVFAACCQGMENFDPALEEAARVFGARPLRVFFKITLPCLAPTIASSALLFFLTVTAAFGVPAIIGIPARLPVLTTKIYTLAKLGGLDGTYQAFIVSLWLLLTALLSLAMNQVIRKKMGYRLVGGKVSRPSLIPLGMIRIPALVLTMGLAIILVALPLGSIVLSSFLKIAGVLKWSNLSWGNYAYLFQMAETQRSFINSVILAVSTGLFCAIAGFLLSYLRERSTLPGTEWLLRLASFPFAIPGTVLALAFIVSYGTGWGHQEIALLGSLSLVGMSYFAKDLALGVQTALPAMTQIDPTLDDAARVFGARPYQVLRWVLLPLMLPALFNAFFLTALPALSELTMSVLLAGPGTETVGTVLYQLQDYANPLASCALATILMILLGVVFLIYKLIGRMVASA